MIYSMFVVMTVYIMTGRTTSSSSNTCTQRCKASHYCISSSTITGDYVSDSSSTQLLAAHVACLRVGTPLEEQHIIDGALAKRHHVAAKYLALSSLSHRPSDNQGLNHFMVNYTLLLQSFREKILEHLGTEASKAMFGCQEIAQQLFNLTGVSTSSGFSAMIQEDKKFDELGIIPLRSNDFIPCTIKKRLRDDVRKELKKDLKKDYHTKLKEVRDEILQKRHVGKLSKETIQVLKDWWISHDKWPYPTEEEKAQLMATTGLDLKKINNWFSNERKRKRDNSTSFESDTNNSMGTTSNTLSTTSKLFFDNESSF